MGALRWEAAPSWRDEWCTAPSVRRTGDRRQQRHRLKSSKSSSGTRLALGREKKKKRTRKTPCGQTWQGPREIPGLKAHKALRSVNSLEAVPDDSRLAPSRF